VIIVNASPRFFLVIIVNASPRFFLLMWILFISMVGYGVHDEDEPLWLLPALQRTRYPAQQIGTYIKNLLPVSRGGSADYKAVSVYRFAKHTK
jgi:hypothetical protein